MTNGMVGTSSAYSERTWQTYFNASFFLMKDVKAVIFVVMGSSYYHSVERPFDIQYTSNVINANDEFQN